MSEEVELLVSVSKKLESAGIEYMITGSMAMAFYSIPRMTRDIDIIIKVSTSDVDMLVDLFIEDFYIDKESVREATLNQDMFNIIHNDSVIKVDLIIRKNEEYRVKEFLRRRKIEIDGSSVWVVAPEDLVLSKLVWAKLSQSELQLRDVSQMIIHHDKLDDDYLEKWSIKLGVNDVLRKVKNHE